MSEHLKGFTEIQWPIAGILTFFVLFLILVTLSSLPSEKRKHERLRQLPLEEGKESAHEPA